MVHYTFQHKSTFIKLSRDVTQYYKKITSSIGTNARIQECTSMNSKMEAQSHNRKTLEPNKRAWKDGALDDLPVIHTTAAHLRSATGRIHKLQAPRSGHEDSGESELPSEW